MDVFVGNILGMLPVLGIHAFETARESIDIDRRQWLTCSGRGASARGRDTAQGFIVQAGSIAAADEVDSLAKHFPTLSQLRRHLLSNGVLVAEGITWRFSQDYTFGSPSTASTFVLGRSSNGRTCWKDANGRTLKEIQEAETQQSGVTGS